MKTLFDSEEEAVAVEDLIGQVIESRRVKTAQEVFSKLCETDRIYLQEKFKLSESEVLAELKSDDIEEGKAQPDEYKRKRSDDRILDGTSASSVFTLSSGTTKRVEYSPEETEQKDMVKLAPKKGAKRGKRKQSTEEEQITQLLL